MGFTLRFIKFTLLKIKDLSTEKKYFTLFVKIVCFFKQFVYIFASTQTHIINVIQIITNITNI